MDWKALLFSFEGRINRAKFWLVYLITVVISIVGSLVGLVAMISLGPQIGGGVSMLVYIALGVYSIWAGLASGVKRLHDREKSGWWLLAWYVAPAVLVGLGALISEIASGVALIAALALWIWMIVELGCLKGTTGPNQYGPDPLPAEPD